MNSCLNSELFKNKILDLTLTPVGVFFVIPDIAHINGICSTHMLPHDGATPPPLLSPDPFS